jgi:hypothetical protein
MLDESAVRTAAQAIAISLVVVALGGVSGAGAADYLPGFPVAIPSGGNGLFGRILVDDFGGGPELEIFCLRGENLVMYDATGQPMPGWPVTTAGCCYFHAAYLGNVTNQSPGKEIVLVGISRIRILNASGTALFPDLLSTGQFWRSDTLSLADLDGDGDDEILMVSWAVQSPGGVGFLYAYHGEGDPVAGYPLPIPVLEFGPNPTSIALGADLDYDGRAEICVTDILLNQQAWDDIPFVAMRSDGTVLPGFPFWPIGGNSVGFPTFADLDNDPNRKSEIVGSGFHTLHGLRFNGGIHWQVEFVPGCIDLEPIVGNFDLDPNLEVVLPGCGLQVFDPDTGSIVGVWSDGFAVDDWNLPTAGDIDGDGVDEIVLITRLLGTPQESRLHVIDPLTMQNEPGWPHSFGPIFGVTANVATLEDLDLDGDLEIIAILGGMLHVLDPPNPGAPVHRASWPTLRGNYARNRDYHYDKPPYPHLTRGDVNRDDQVDLGDVIRTGQVLFYGFPTKCPKAIDVNGDASEDIADVISLVSYLFLSGAPPVAPFPDCEPIPRTPECMVFSCP